MGRVVLFGSMSLDGFITGPNSSLENGLGDGGLLLHEWAMDESNDVNQKFVAEVANSAGAIITGRTTYDQSVRWWGANGPTGSARTPTFVVTHHVPEDSPPDGVYTFVTEGIESALERAKAVAGVKDVTMSGTNIGTQYLRAGLLDEVQIHLVPVLLGGGKRLFDPVGNEPLRLERVQVLDTPSVTHLRYRVLK